MSNGRAFGSEGRWSIGSTANLEEGRMYPDLDNAGVRTEGRPFLMLLCADFADAFTLERVIAEYVRVSVACAVLWCSVG